jgi:3-oxoacid CoA-transferase
MAARNFNEDMATAAKIVIAEVDEIVEVGDLDPNTVHTPSCYVDYIVQTDTKHKPIENLVLDDGTTLKIDSNPSRIAIAKRVAQEVHDGMTINMGIGIPTLVPYFIDRGKDVVIHSENGILGVKGNPRPGEEDGDLINASKESVTVELGATFFSSSDSFGMIRGGHVDLTILGGMQVSATRDVANWYAPGYILKGMGGAMDLISGGTDAIIAMEHNTKDGKSKIVEKCDLPLTGENCCSKVITEKAVFDFSINGRITLIEIAQGYTLDDIRACTDAKFEISPTLKQI